MSNRRSISAGEESTEVNISPLIDMVFILLIFFMLESDFLRPQVLYLSHARGGAASTPTAAPPIMIELHADNSMWVNRVNYPFSEIAQAIGDIDPSPDSAAVVATDPGVPLQRAVDVIDALQQHGLTNVSMREARRFE